MAYFDSQNGWIQFAFANEQDEYYLPSLMKVKYDRYLFYRLKNMEYEAIYFFSGLEKEKFEVRFLDEASAAYYEKIKPKTFFSKAKNVKSEYNEWNPAEISNNENTEKLFYSILDGKKKAALVMPIKMFSTFFQDKNRRNRLVGWCSRKRQSNNLLLVTSSVKAEESNEYLIKEDGIFASISEEIREAIYKDSSRHFYKKLKDNLGERCIFLNEAKWSQIRPIVWKGAFRVRQNAYQGDQLQIDREQLDKIAMAVEWYYHSDKFKEEIDRRLTLTENKKREYQIINKDIQNPRILRMMLALLHEVGDSLSVDEFHSYLMRNYPKNREDCYIYTNSLLLQQWNYISSNYRQNKFDVSYIGNQLKDIVLRGDRSQSEEEVSLCIKEMMRALSAGDMDTFHHGGKALEYLIDMYYDRSQTQESVWKYYQEILQISEENFRLMQDNEKYKKNIDELNAEIYTLFERDRELEKYQERYQEESIDKKAIEMRIGQCDTEREALTESIHVNDMQIYYNKDSIGAYEKAVADIARGDVNSGNRHELLEQAINRQRQMIEHTTDSIKKIDSLVGSSQTLKEKLVEKKEYENMDWEERYQLLRKELN